MKQLLIPTILSIILLFGCSPDKRKENTISISGAFALYPMVVKWAEEYNKVYPDIRINISGGGAGKGMADAMAGSVDLGMFSRAISDQEKEKGVWWIGLTTDAVVPTISDQNPYLRNLSERGVTREEFARIFVTGEITGWHQLVQTGTDATMAVYTRSDACGAAETWAKYMGSSQENLKGIGIYGDPGLAEAVTKSELSIGFNNTIFAYDPKTNLKRPGIEVIPIDVNENGTIDPEEDFYDSFTGVLEAIADGRYPSPPARELYFVAKEKPGGRAVTGFLRWILTDGQKYVAEAGYVPLDKARVDAYLRSLE
jgi:phosphate transport system substrate-binding protein